MAVVVISSAVLGSDNVVTATGTVDGTATTIKIPQDLLLSTGDETAQRNYVASRLAEEAAELAALVTEIAGLTGTVTV